MKDPLPKGAVGAIRTLHWRVPLDAPPEVAKVADEAFDVVVDVMRGTAGRFGVSDRLSAARVVRDEVCGPIARTINVNANVTHELGDKLDAAMRRVNEADS